MALANPETGEVHRVLPGEAAFFRRDTWHHAFNQSAEPLRVLELFAPPPSQGTSGAYARTKPILAAQHTQDQWLGRWPMARAEARGAHTIQVLRETDVMWRLEGEELKTLVGLWISTEHLTVGQIELQPGQHTELHTHGGDESLYLLAGTLHVHTPGQAGQSWFELNPRDGFYVPQGVPHQYYNVSAEPARLLFAVAPCYLPAHDGEPELCAIGLDVGGTKIAGALVGLPAGSLSARRTIPTQPERGGRAVLDDALGLARELLEAAAAAGLTVTGIGVSVCELVDLAGNVTSGQTVAWDGLPVQAEFARLAPAVVESDVRAHALAEASLGAGPPAVRFATVGTGISSCLVQDGRPYAGARGNALVLASSPLQPALPGVRQHPLAGAGRIRSGPALVTRFNAWAGARPAAPKRCWPRPRPAMPKPSRSSAAPARRSAPAWAGW